MRNVFSRNENGATVAEFAVAAGLFFMIIFGIIEFGRLFYTHNALTDAARRGARYAVLHNKNAGPCVKNAAVYGERDTQIGPPPTCTPLGPALINGLAPANIDVTYSGDFEPDTGSVTVTVQNYTFALSIPIVGRTLNMPNYRTTLTAESAGEVPGGP